MFSTSTNDEDNCSLVNTLVILERGHLMALVPRQHDIQYPRQKNELLTQSGRILLSALYGLGLILIRDRDN